MRLVIFGLTVSSSWGNGHATLWRGLISAFDRSGHHVIFYERDVPYYADNRDITSLPGNASLILYPDWPTILPSARHACNNADAVIITSFCPDALAATDIALTSRAAIRCFYDLDTPITLAHLAAGHQVSYIPPNGLTDFDLVLSFTGGAALTALRSRLGARRAEPLYGWADPEFYRPTPRAHCYAADLSYLGTYAADRQQTLVTLFVEAAIARPHQRFVIGGAQYPEDFPWTDNIHFVRHLPPPEHPAFYSSSSLTLNITRASMAALGWCPSGRLFEAAACGTPILSDIWPGLEDFFEPGREIMLATNTEQVLAALDTPPPDLAQLAIRARIRMLDQHTAAHRAVQLINLLESALQPAI